MKDYLYLDVLPQRTAEEVGGFSREATRQRGFALGVTWNERSGFRAFDQDHRSALIEAMDQSRTVVGYNCAAFDFEILQYEPPHYCDLFVEIAAAAKQSVALKDVFRALGTRPVLASAHRLTERWMKGERGEVITAFSRHVGAIRRIHQHVLQHGWLLYRDLNGETKRLQLRLHC